MPMTLDQLRNGQTVVMLGFGGGRGLARKLDAMGLRPGKELRMVSSQLMRGPITVLLDGRQVALGRGIARRILVEPRR